MSHRANAPVPLQFATVKPQDWFSQIIFNVSSRRAAWLSIWFSHGGSDVFSPVRRVLTWLRACVVAAETREAFTCRSQGGRHFTVTYASVSLAGSCLFSCVLPILRRMRRYVSKHLVVRSSLLCDPPSLPAARNNREVGQFRKGFLPVPGHGQHSLDFCEKMALTSPCDARPVSLPPRLWEATWLLVGVERRLCAKMAQPVSRWSRQAPAKARAEVSNDTACRWRMINEGGGASQLVTGGL